MPHTTLSGGFLALCRLIEDDRIQHFPPIGDLPPSRFLGPEFQEDRLDPPPQLVGDFPDRTQRFASRLPADHGSVFCRYARKWSLLATSSFLQKVFRRFSDSYLGDWQEINYLDHARGDTNPTRQRGDRRRHALASASVPRWRVGLVWPVFSVPVSMRSLETDRSLGDFRAAGRLSALTGGWFQHAGLCATHGRTALTWPEPRVKS